MLSSVFELHASPADADLAEHLTVGRFIMLFFLVDDGPPEEARALARSIRADAGADATYGDGEPARQLLLLVDDFLGRGLPTDRLTALIAGFCAATAEESAGPPPPGQLHARRAETVGARPHIECWRLLRGLPLPPPGSPDRPLPEASVEAVHLVNDLLSAAVEERAGGSVAAGNTVLARAHATGDRAGAVDSAVARHNGLVATPAAGRHRPLAALLGELVDGNRSAHHALTGVRYPGLPLDVFDRLHTVGGAERR
ncbi:terpene synthase family protein [Kitasatospora purpeofusca]|uniref:terpene synthase family protein n=1 Tax=Kitasatospora purpeofusca TaxID=67352 RepID=UPI00364A5E23